MAVSKIFSVNEAATLEYVSGYFFRRLMSFHKTDCDTCGKFGGKITASSESPCRVQDSFLYLKRYCTEEATLFKCSTHFNSFIQKVVQIATHCFDTYMEVPGIIGLASNTALHNLFGTPVFCSDNMKIRLVFLVCKTIILNKVKWHNNELRGEKRGKKRASAQNKAAQKLKKLSHQ